MKKSNGLRDFLIILGIIGIILLLAFGLGWTAFDQTKRLVGDFEFATMPVLTDPAVPLSVLCVRVENEKLGYTNYYLTINGEFISNPDYGWPPRGFVASLHDKVKVVGVVRESYDLRGSHYYTVEVDSLGLYVQPR